MLKNRRAFNNPLKIATNLQISGERGRIKGTIKGRGKGKEKVNVRGKEEGRTNMDMPGGGLQVYYSVNGKRLPAAGRASTFP